MDNRRLYITDSGAELMLPETDERVMTIDELTTKYAVKQPAKQPQGLCPRCHTYCHGDCHA